MVPVDRKLMHLLGGCVGSVPLTAAAVLPRERVDAPVSDGPRGGVQVGTVDAPSRRRVREGVGHCSAGDGEPAGDLSGDQVCVSGQAIFAFFIGHALVRAQQDIYRGEEFVNCCGSCSSWSRIRDLHVVPASSRDRILAVARAVRSSEVVVEHELPGVWSLTDLVQFLCSLVVEPCLDQVVGEDAALEQEVVIGFQGVQDRLQ